MPGGFLGDMPPEDKIEVLNAQITELEKRRNNLQDEVDKYYRDYKNKLNFDYNVKVKKLEEENIVRNSILNKREDDIKKKEDSSDSRINTLETVARNKLTSATQKEEETEDLKILYQSKLIRLEEEYREKNRVLVVDRNKLEEEKEDVRQKKQSLIGIQNSFLTIELQNKQATDKLEQLRKDTEGRITFSEHLLKEIAQKDIKLSQREIIIKTTELNSENSSKETKKLLKEAQAERDAAKKLSEELSVQKKVFEAQSEKLRQQAKDLETLKANLAELELTLNERDRFLILKGRIISDKLKIIQDLRAMDKKNA